MSTLWAFIPSGFELNEFAILFSVRGKLGLWNITNKISLHYFNLQQYCIQSWIYCDDSPGPAQLYTFCVQALQHWNMLVRVITQIYAEKAGLMLRKQRLSLSSWLMTSPLSVAINEGRIFSLLIWNKIPPCMFNMDMANNWHECFLTPVKNI